MSISDFQPFYDIAWSFAAIVVFGLGYIGGIIR